MKLKVGQILKVLNNPNEMYVEISRVFGADIPNPNFDGHFLHNRVHVSSTFDFNRYEVFADSVEEYKIKTKKH